MWEVLVSAASTVLGYTFVLMTGLWCWFQWVKWDFLQAARKLPCIFWAFPVFGHLHRVILTDAEVVCKLLLTTSKEAVAKSLYSTTLWMGPVPYIMIHKPGDIHKILTSSCSVEVGKDMNYMRWALGNGLLTAPNHIFKVTSRHISPLFHHRNVQQLMTVFNQNSREMTQEFAELIDSKPIDVLQYTMTVALKTICQLIFGSEQKFDTKTKEFHGLLKAVEEIPKLYAERINKPWLRLDFVFELLYKKEIDKINTSWKIFTEVPLSVAKANYANKLKNKPLSNYSDDLQHPSESIGQLNLIDLYSELQKRHPQFTEDDLRNEIRTLFAAGTDTAGLAIATGLLVLGAHTDIQKRVYKEIISLIGSDNDVTKDHISKMPYLDMVFKEILRWANIIPYFQRETSGDLKLSTVTIPTGNRMHVCLIGPHMDPSIYPEPERFDPERFSPEISATRDKNSYVPFSYGSRMCIGRVYAEYLIKTTLVHAIRRYEFSTDMDIYNLKKNLVTTLLNSEGYNVTFRNRN